MNNISLILSLIVFTILGCAKIDNSKTKEFRENTNQTVDVRNEIVDLETDLFIRFGNFTLIDNYIVFADYASYDPYAIHVFDRENFEHINSTGLIGRGPGEITRLGSISKSYCDTYILASDYGNYVRWKFQIDSIVKGNKNFLPTDKFDMDPDFFLVQFDFINDSMALGTAVVPLNYHSMEMTVATSNFQSNKTQEFGYSFPNLNDNYETYINTVVSVKDSMYVKAYKNIDLLTICDLHGNLICNIRGPLMGIRNESNRINSYFDKVFIYKDYIVASYLGSASQIKEENGEIKVVFPSSLIVFDKTGNYLKTINVGHEFSSFCLDEEYNRAIFFFENREPQFGYFDLSNI